MKGEVLKETRVRLFNWTQGELAERLGISQSMVAQMEAGVRPVPPARERQLQRMLGQLVTDERGERD